METIVTIGIVVGLIAFAVAVFGVPDEEWKRRNDRSKGPWTD